MESLSGGSGDASEEHLPGADVVHQHLHASSLTSEEKALLEFRSAASQLSPSELREFVHDHIEAEIQSVRAMPVERRGQAFRSLCAEWHPDKCPAIPELATEVFQRLQAQKALLLHA
uniref:J domain-containing protein n=1 Tax=Noctiluca scintillans TaxID=2966 RepID=A0A7S1AJS4_NOCSC